jgi:hypothetical protein
MDQCPSEEYVVLLSSAHGCVFLIAADEIVDVVAGLD